MELEWPSKFTDDQITKSPDENLATLQDLYPEGLSGHGARYAQARLITDEAGLNAGWEAMAGGLSVESPEKDREEVITIRPDVVQFEFQLELVRRLDFEEKLSRFQSCFAFQELDEAVEFCHTQRGGDAKIVEVEADSFEERDMDLVSANQFGDILRKGRDYWEGNAGSDDPTWEVVMEPPVEVVDVVDDLV